MQHLTKHSTVALHVGAVVCASLVAARVRAQLPPLREEIVQLQAVLQGPVLRHCPADSENVNVVIQRLSRLAVYPPLFDSLARLESIQGEIATRLARRDTLAAQINRQQHLHESIAAKNSQAVVDALRTGALFPTPDPGAVLSRYLGDTARAVSIGPVKLIMTPFGYFEYEPIVHLTESRGAASLVWHRLELLDFSPAAAALDASIFRVPLLVEAGYASGSPKVAIAQDPPDAQLKPKDLGRGSGQSWKWNVTRSLGLARHVYPASFRLTSPQDGSDIALISNSIEVSNWWNPVWDSIMTLKSLGELGALLVSFLAGKYHWAGRVKKSLPRRGRRRDT
jgi:hypothetical protein